MNAASLTGPDDRRPTRPTWPDGPRRAPDNLQPGPAALTDGVEQLHRIVQQWSAAHG